ncbi:MAG: GFA family protein [Thermodesulfobacteriota bacterium]
MLHGSCLCSAVAYEVAAPLEGMHHCHCGRCRKQHGAAFATYARAPRAAFRFTRGADLVRSFRSSEQVARTFCGTCGANLQFVHDAVPDALWIAVASLDDDPGLRPEAHIFAASSAPWHEITDGLPRHDEYPPGE